MFYVYLSLFLFTGILLLTFYSFCRIPAASNRRMPMDLLIQLPHAAAEYLEGLLSVGDMESIDRIIRILEQRGDARIVGAHP